MTRAGRTGFFAAIFTLAIALLAATTERSLAADSNWEQIKSTGKLRVGVLPYPPNSFIDTKTGKWEGFVVDMAQDIAKVMGVKVEYVESSFGNAALDLQSNKMDLMFGLQATPLRAMAIDFAGPVYELSYSAINGKNFKGRTWEDYNNPNVKVAVKTGSSSALAFRMYAPKAQRLELRELSDAIMSVQAGQADALGDMAIASLVAKVRNPQLGDLVQPSPVRGLPSYAGMRFDTDRRFRDFIHRWAEFHRLSGTITDWMKKALLATGMTEADIPADMQF